ncbi:KPTN [Blepharisma stoltei]|uniref:Uncharacterized protein n=1 Tax=Blepharisma stoltei TaxID=1481888 RepID=A0AAU9IC43_9CILI|nr:unnamed protein product [Blepharisma stoltei]
MELRSFHELSNYTNIYSLSTFDIKSKRGCVINTCKNVHRLWCSKEGEVKLVKLNFPRIYADTEILGNAGMCWKSMLVTCIICRNRNNTFSMNLYIRRADDVTGMTEHSFAQDLDFVPYKVYMRDLDDELIIFLGGSDCRLHLYKADFEYLSPVVSGPLESLTRDDELIQHQAPVMAMHTQRNITFILIGIACQNGDTKLLKYSHNKQWNKEASWHVILDGPISGLLLFKLEAGISDLLVASAVGYAVVYRDVAQEGLARKNIIPCTQDAITCVVTSDIDFDGQREIILGTYNQTVCCYKLKGNVFELIWSKTFPQPIMSICELDINRDGIFELIVVTMYGISVFSPDFEAALEKLRNIKNSLDKAI